MQIHPIQRKRQIYSLHGRIYVRLHSSRDPLCVWDEKPYQLICDARKHLPMSFADDPKIDFGYIRNGTCSIFAFIEPLGGTHYVNIRGHHVALEWAEEIRYLVEVIYSHVQKNNTSNR